MYPTQDDNNTGGLPILKKKVQSSTDGLPILKKKEPVIGGIGGDFGSDTNSSHLLSESQVDVLNNMKSSPGEPIKEVAQTISHDDPDPIKTINDGLKKQKENLLGIGGESTGQDKVQKELRSSQIGDINKSMMAVNAYAFPTSETAENYISHTLSQKGIHAADLDEIPVDVLKSDLDPYNETQKLAADKYMEGRDARTAMKSSWDINEMAIKYAGLRDKHVGELIDRMGGDLTRLPKQFVGQQLYNFLSNPDVIERTKTDDDFNTKYKEAKYNFYSNFPETATTIVSQKIGQHREDMGLNHGFYNDPSASSMQKVVDDMVANGQLNDQEKNIYEQRLKPILENVNDSQVIPTPDFAHGFTSSLGSGVSGMVNSVKDVLNDATANVLENTGVLENKQDKLRRLIKQDYSTVSIDPKHFWTQLGSETGHMTGFVTPMIIGSELGSLAGISKGASELLTNGLMFESPNREYALKTYKDPAKQYIYTILSTAGDMFLTKLLPTQKISQALKGEMKTEIQSVIRDFTDKKITAEQAKQTLLDKASSFIPKVLKGNVQTGGVMAGYNMFHNGLEAAFGGRDVSFDKAAGEAMNSFKSGFVGGTLISALGARSRPNEMSAKVAWEVAKDAPQHLESLDEAVKLNPSLLPKVEELKKNITTAGDIHSELEKTTLTQDQKEKYLLRGLQEKILQEKAQSSQVPSIKKEAAQEAKKVQEINEGVLNGVPEEKTIQNQAKNEVKELYDNDIIPVGDKAMLEDAPETEGGKPKFNPEKSLAYLKVIAQQANGISEKGDILEGGKRDQDMKHYPKSLIEFANDVFPKYQKTREDFEQNDIGENTVASIPETKASPEENKHPDIVSNPNPIENKVKEIEATRDEEINKTTKPDAKLSLVPAKDLAEAKDPLKAKYAHDDIKSRYLELKKLIECLWT